MESLLLRISDLSQWHIGLAATWLLLQGCVVPSVPEEIVISTVGMLMGQGRIAPPLALGAILAGLLPANSAAFFMGSLARTRMAHPGFLGRSLSSPRVAAATATLRRHGALLVLVTRFTPFIRGPVYLAAGLSGLEVRRFFVLDASAALIQVPLLLWAGSRLGTGATMAEAWQRIGWLSGGLVLAAVTVAVVRRVMGASRPVADAVSNPPPC